MLNYLSARLKTEASLKIVGTKENKMALWMAIIVYYSFYSGCLIAKVIRMGKEHVETGERYYFRDGARTHAASLKSC